MHKLAHKPLLDDLKKIRDSRRNAAVLEYRQAVEVIASGDVEPAELGAGLDDVMVRLAISDDTLASDVEVMREYQERTERIAAFESTRAEAQQRRDKAQAEVEKLEAEHKSFHLRYAKATSVVMEIAAPFTRAMRDRQRLDKLELDNERLFEVLDDG